MKIIIGKNLNIDAPFTVCPQWNGIEVHPCKEYPDGKGASFVEQCEPEEADFWSVYLHLKAGGLECVADLPTEALANSLADLLTLTQKAFKP